MVPLLVAEAATARWPCAMEAERLVAFLYVCSVLVTAPLSLRISDPDLYGSPLQWVTSVVVGGMVLVLFFWWLKLKWLAVRIERQVSEYHRALEENEKLRERLRQVVKEYEDMNDSLLAALLEKDALEDPSGAVGGELAFLAWLRGSAESEAKDREVTSSQGGEDQSKMPDSVLTLSKPGQGSQCDADEVKRQLEIYASIRDKFGKATGGRSSQQMSAVDCCVLTVDEN